MSSFRYFTSQTAKGLKLIGCLVVVCLLTGCKLDKAASELSFKPAWGGLFVGQIQGLGDVKAHLYEDHFKYESIDTRNGATLILEYMGNRFETKYLQGSQHNDHFSLAKDDYIEDPAMKAAGTVSSTNLVGTFCMGTNVRPVSFYLNRAYSEQVWHPAEKRPRFNGDPPRFSFSARIPVFDQNQLGSAVEQELCSRELYQYQEDVKVAAETFGERLSHWLDGDQNCYFTRYANWHLSYADSNQISLSRWDYCFSGGAHGNLNIGSYNYRWADGRMQPLYIDGFFKKNNWQDIIIEKLAADLKRQGAGWPDYDTLEEYVDNGDCIFDRDGIVFQFEPYAVACYAEGTYCSRIKWSDLRPFLADWDGTNVPKNINSPIEVNTRVKDSGILDIPSGQQWELSWTDVKVTGGYLRKCRIHIIGGSGVISVTRALQTGEKGEDYIQIGNHRATLLLDERTRFRVEGRDRQSPCVVIRKYNKSTSR